MRRLNLHNRLIRTNIKDFLHLQHIPAVLLNIPEHLLFPPRRLHLHIRSELYNTITQRLNIHEILSDKKVCYIIFRKVGFRVYAYLTFGVVPDYICAQRQQVLIVLESVAWFVKDKNSTGLHYGSEEAWAI